MAPTKIRKAHIHHKDGNSLNNDPSNWQVLCSKCHRKTFSCEKKNHAGFYIRIVFKRWLREEVLKAAYHRCQLCGAVVGDVNQRRCDWCSRIAGKASRVEWKDGRTMCRECFDDWLAQGKPTEFTHR